MLIKDDFEEQTIEYVNTWVNSSKFSNILFETKQIFSETKPSSDSCITAFIDVFQKKENEKLYQITEEKEKNKLINDLKLFEQDDGYYDLFETDTCRIASEYSMKFLGQILQNIVLKYCENSRFMIALCRCLCRYDLNEVEPWGPVMVMALINHKNVFVKEEVVSVIENWADKEMLPMLRSLDVRENWMKRYLEEVIDFLQRA